MIKMPGQSNLKFRCVIQSGTNTCFNLSKDDLSHIFQIKSPTGGFDFYAPTHVTEIPEGDELHNIADGLLAGVGPQHAGISIQELHGGEVGVANADDDDGHGQLGRLDDGVAGLVHVADDAVCDDEESEVLLQGRGGEKRRADIKDTKGETLESCFFMSLPNLSSFSSS